MRRLFLILLLGILCAAAGCQIIDKERLQDPSADNLPHNMPADWERNRFGIAY